MFFENVPDCWGFFFPLSNHTKSYWPSGFFFWFVFSQRHHSVGLNMSHWVCLFTTNSSKLGEEITINCHQCSVLFHTSCSFLQKLLTLLGCISRQNDTVFKHLMKLTLFFFKNKLQEDHKDVNCCLWFIQLWKTDLIIDVYKQSSDFYKLTYLLLNCAAQTLFERSVCQPKQCPSLVCFPSICYRQWSDRSII